MGNNTCQTCAHWGAPDERQKGATVRRCMAIRHDESGAILWGEEDWEYNADWCTDKEWVRAALAVAMDGSGYSAKVMTRGRFGCVLHTTTAPGAEKGVG